MNLALSFFYLHLFFPLIRISSAPSQWLLTQDLSQIPRITWVEV